MARRVRIPLRRVVSDDDGKPVYVTVSGFGDFIGKYMVGRVESRTRRVVLVSVKFAAGAKSKPVEKAEYFRVGDGKMLPANDRQKSGWKINVKDLDTEYCSFPDAEAETTSAPSGFSVVSREVLERYDMEELVAEVWRGSEGELYIKTFRISTDPKVKRARELPAIVPFNRLLELVAEFSGE